MMLSFSMKHRKWLEKMYYADFNHSAFLSSELMTKMTQKTKTYCVIN